MAEYAQPMADARDTTAASACASSRAARSIARGPSHEISAPDTPPVSLAAALNRSPRAQGLVQLQRTIDQSPRVQALARSAAPARVANQTCLPDALKAGVETLSGLSMDHVRVHYDSSQPARFSALAYAQGRDIHVAPGQQRHLPHEAWHVVQQAQGRVKPTMQMKGDTPVNDDPGLEREADVMGAKAAQSAIEQAGERQGDFIDAPAQHMPSPSPVSLPNVQRRSLAQAGAGGGLDETEDQVLIGGNVGPRQGSVYEVDLGAKATKTAALSAAGASYADFVEDVPVDGLLSVNSAFAAINAAKPLINSYIADLEGNADVTTAEATTHIKQNIIEPAINPDFKTAVSGDELNEIYTALRNPVTKNVNNKFFANPKADNVINTHIRGKINAEWRANDTVQPIDPFLYRPASTVNGNDFKVSYQHSPDWPGYVTYITDDDATASMRVAGAIQNPDAAGIPDQFGRKHHETGDDVLADDLDLDDTDSRVTNERRLDSMTKLAGEGARFLCIRNNLGVMTDRSRFYVVGDEQSRYVTLEDLWSSWATAFGKQNNIGNATVRAAIVNGSDWTYDQGNGQEARVLNQVDDQPFGANDVNLT